MLSALDVVLMEMFSFEWEQLYVILVMVSANPSRALKGVARVSRIMTTLIWGKPIPRKLAMVNKAGNGMLGFVDSG